MQMVTLDVPNEPLYYLTIIYIYIIFVYLMLILYINIDTGNEYRTYLNLLLPIKYLNYNCYYFSLDNI